MPLVLFAYRSAIDSLTGTSPFLLMFGRKPKVCDLDDGRAYDISSYQQQLQAKLAELQGFLETNLVEAAQTQKLAYDCQSRTTKFHKGDSVWLSIPTAGKLRP